MRSLTAYELEAVKHLKQQVAKELCEESHLFFTRYFFKQRQNIKFKVNWHHHLIADVVERVMRGEIKNVVINVPPGSSKTEMAVVNFIARGLAINPRARFLHLSYSDDLALLNSQTAKDIVLSDEFQAMWPMTLRADSKSSKRWNVVVDGKAAGGVYAASIGGQITGFRAGHMADGFQGAIIIDDPLKVDDAFSAAQRIKVNRKFVNTVKSRKANPDTPIVVIMQRLAEEDPTGFIRSGKVPGDWTYIEIPALITDEYVELHLTPKLAARVERAPKDKDGRFSYWAYKEPLADMLSLELKDSYTFNSQYQQRPSPLGGALIKGAWYKRYKVLPRLRYRIITADTAMKTKERNDYSVFEHWGVAENGDLYLLDVLRGKWEAADLRRQARMFWSKCKAQDSDGYMFGKLLKMYVEDKSSGTGLIQDLVKPENNEAPRIPVEGVERNTDKLTCWMAAIPHIEAGAVWIPHEELEVPWVSDFVLESESLTAQMTHAHDDQIDPMCDAIQIMRVSNINVWSKL